ncbi:MAG: hypothetical protein AB1679_11630 [Actinomycetota bacterium]
MTRVVLAGIPNPVEVVTDAASNVARATTGSLFDGLGSFLVSWVADGCRDIGREVVAALSGPAQIDFAHGWWAGPRGRALAGDIGVLAIALTLIFVFLAVLQGVLAGDPGGMLRAVLTQLPLSVLGMVTVVGATELLLGVTDEATHLVLGDAPANLGRFVDGLTATAAVPAGGLALTFLLVVFLLGAFLVWVELAVRSALVFLLVAFAPLVLAARIWPGARGIFRRLVELGIAVIVSKFVIAVVLALGSAALAGGGPTEGASATPLTMASLLGGATLMGLAAFTPFVVLRLLPVVETAVVAHGIASSPVRGAQAAAAAGALPGRVTRMVAAGHPATSAAGPAAMAAGPMRAAGPSAHPDGRRSGTRAATSPTSADHARPPQRLDGTSKTASTPPADRSPNASAPDRRIELPTRPDRGSGGRPPKGVDQ